MLLNPDAKFCKGCGAQTLTTPAQSEALSSAPISDDVEATKVAPVRQKIESSSDYYEPQQKTLSATEDFEPRNTISQSYKGNNQFLLYGLIAVLIVTIGGFVIYKNTQAPDIAYKPQQPLHEVQIASNSQMTDTAYKDSSNIVTAKIYPVLAPSETSGILTQMLVANSNVVKLIDLKAQIESIFPKNEKGDVRAARVLNEKGLFYFKQENYADAANYFYDATKANPADIEALNNYAYALIKAGKYGDAEKILGQVLSFAPGRTNAWANLGDVYANQNKADAASAAFVVGFQLASNKEKALNFLRTAGENDPNEKLRTAINAAIAQITNQ